MLTSYDVSYIVSRIICSLFYVSFFNKKKRYHLNLVSSKVSDSILHNIGSAN